jgi:hypothetical protein
MHGLSFYDLSYKAGGSVFGGQERSREKARRTNMKSRKYIVFSLLVALSMLVMPGLTATAQYLPQWTQANPVPPNELMANVTSLAVFNGNLFAGTTSWLSAVPIDSAVYRSKDGKNWSKVSPYGFGNPLINNIIYAMVVFQDKLYVGTGGGDAGDLAQLWRTSNGVTWERVDTTSFGNPTNAVVNRLIVYKGKLFAAVFNTEMGIQLYRSASGNAGSWVKATTVFDDPMYSYQILSSAISFNDTLYVAVEGGGGVGVWRSKTGSTWEKVTPDGLEVIGEFGAGGFSIYKDQLFWGIENDAIGGQILRSQDGKHWSKVMEGGFGDINNVKISNFMPIGGDLYAFTSNWVSGTEVWRSSDLKNWTQANQDGFDMTCQLGDQMDCNWSTPNDFATVIFNGGLYAGNWNWNGGEIWKMDLPQ